MLMVDNMHDARAVGPDWRHKLGITSLPRCYKDLKMATIPTWSRGEAGRVQAVFRADLQLKRELGKRE